MATTLTTTLTDQLPDRQRAALEHFEGEGFALTGSRSYASGPVLVVENDQGVEIEIDDVGCFLATGDERFATASVNAGGE